jgi:hypothetical protein
MSFIERMRRFPTAGWAALFALLLVFPLLGSFGFWDPWELNLAERAREMVRAGNLTDPTVGRRYTAEPPLDLFFAALGMKVFGVRELGARFGNAIFAVGTLLGVYWAGLGLFRRRAALLATLALGTMPLFFLQARQLTSDMPLVFGLTLALGGLGRFAWPADGRRRLGYLGVATIGMVIGTLSGGAMLGVALPGLALAGTVAVAWGLTPAEPVPGSSPLCPAGVGPDLPSGRSFGRGLLASPAGILVLVVGGVGLLVLVLTLTQANVAGQYSILLGGTPRGGTPPQKFDYLIRQIGFGVFPWSALVVFALGRAIVRLGEDDDRLETQAAQPAWGAVEPHRERSAAPSGLESGARLGTARLAFGQLYLLVFAAFGYGLSTVFVLMSGDARFAPLAPLALALGAFLDEALEGERAEPVLGLVVATGTMVVARDLFLAPEELPSLHLLNKVKWPPQLSLGPAFLLAGLAVAAGIYLGLATRARTMGKGSSPRSSGPGWSLRQRLEDLLVRVGRWGFHGAIVAAVVFAALVAHGLQPTLSRHYSFKPVLESYTRYAQGDEPIARYRVEGHGTGFYSAGEMVDLQNQDRVVAFLQPSRRAFVLVAAEELAALDAAFRLKRTDYFVVDASSSRFLLLSNRLSGGQEDQNPLKKYVWMSPRPPITVAAGDNPGVVRYEWPAERPPWPPPRVPAVAEFGNAIELLGADYPPEARRPGKIPLTLHFRVNRRPPPGFKIFVHLDSSGSPRVLGDHAPLDGTFPTSYWLPGEYIKDYVEVDIPLMTTPAGVYTFFIGFWPGGEQKRLPITSGTLGDGFDRARVGTIDIR